MFPGKIRRWILIAARCGYAAVMWLILLHLPTDVPGPGLDSSWQAVLHYAQAARWQFGKDIVFTYGPLGYLPIGQYQYAGTTFFATMVYQVCFKAFYLCLVCYLSSRMSGGAAIVFLVLSALMALLPGDAVYLLTIAYSAVVLCGRGRCDNLLRVPALGFVTVAALIKVTFLLYGGFMLACVTLHFLCDRRWRSALLVAGLTGLFSVTLWLWHCGQSLIHLPAFLRYGLDVASGYSSAMATPPRGRPGLAGLAILSVVAWHLLNVAFLRPSGDRRVLGSGRESTLMFLLLSAGLFLAWKQGFTRWDWGHQPTFFVYAMIILAASPIFFRGIPLVTDQSLAQHSLALALVSGLAVWSALSFDSFSLSDSVRRNVQWLLSPAAQQSQMDAYAKTQAELYSLPKVRAAVGSSAMDVFGFEQATALLNELNYRPPPVIQAYSAYTPRLINLNTAFYRSKRAPEFVLFKLQTLDNRYPTLDNAVVLLELTWNFRPVLCEGGYLLLQRRSQQRTAIDPHLTAPLAIGTFSAGEKLDLPEAAGPIWCELEFRENVLGRLVRFALGQPPTYIDVFSGDRPHPSRWRVVPGMTSVGFLLSPEILSSRDYLRFLRRDEQPRVRTLEVAATREFRWLMEPRISYRFRPLPSPPVLENASLLDDLLQNDVP